MFRTIKIKLTLDTVMNGSFLVKQVLKIINKSFIFEVTSLGKN